MSDYLQELKEISDSFTAAGSSISDRDLIAATLAGLPNEFESFTDFIMLRLTSSSLDELHGLLLTKELSLNRRKKCVSSSMSEPFHALSIQAQPPLLPNPPQVYVAQNPLLQHSFRYNSNRGKINRGSYRGNSSTNNFHRSNSSAQSRGSSSGPRAPC
ncbi:uncharacterized protein [Pyrus communis]|uniref:uncharacterized protein n=1 Tax=Pyrus communis TaxID=23211 RepID=UPI0035BF63E5